MSQFPADQTHSTPASDDPFDELARLINGDHPTMPAPVPSPAPMRAAPAPAVGSSDDYDIQAALEGRSVPVAAPTAAPTMPVFDPSVPVAQAAPAGLHQVPTRGPLARVAQDTAPAAEESPLDAIFDLTALRAAFEKAPAAEVQPIPQPVAEQPVAEAVETPVAVEPDPIVDAAPPAPPVFQAPPLAYVPESDAAQVVEPPIAFAPTPSEPLVDVPAPQAQMLNEMEAMLAAEPIEAAPAPVDPAPIMPAADFEIDLESELEAALMSDLSAIHPEPRAEPQPVAAPSFIEPVAAVAAPLVAEAAGRPTHDNVAARGEGRSRRAMALAAAIVMMGGGSAVAWTLMGGAEPDEVPVILAQAGAVRVVPADKGGAAIPNRDAALFKADAKPHQDALRPGAEKPIEIAAAQTPRPVKVKTQLRRALPPTARKVRTVVVKPDGTIVSGTEIVGTVEPRRIEPVAKPVVDAVAKPVRTVEVAPAEPVAAKKIVRAPAKPAPVAKPVRVAKTEPAKKPIAAPAVRRSGEYVVQISSRRSSESARRAFSKLQKRYASLLGDRNAEYQRTEIDGKGTFYRVRVLASSKGDARTLCASLKRAGGSCFVTR